MYWTTKDGRKLKISEMKTSEERLNKTTNFGG